MELHWRPERAEHAGTRSQRYPGATDIMEAWTYEAWADPRRVYRDPDPKSRPGIVRVTGRSLSGLLILTVIAEKRYGQMWGVTAWEASGKELREYKENTV